ncbi:hypothetical protein C8Q80DRAFT_330984 [Daedaleopsis nitida]|nr:hypothetical protein C8Q80DRAFT_330984 [Daedaleopsis nitida]
MLNSRPTQPATERIPIPHLACAVSAAPAIPTSLPSPPIRTCPTGLLRARARAQTAARSIAVRAASASARYEMPRAHRGFCFRCEIVPRMFRRSGWVAGMSDGSCQWYYATTAPFAHASRPVVSRTCHVWLWSPRALPAGEMTSYKTPRSLRSHTGVATHLNMVVVGPAAGLLTELYNTPPRSKFVSFLTPQSSHSPSLDPPFTGDSGQTRPAWCPIAPPRRRRYVCRVGPPHQGAQGAIRDPWLSPRVRTSGSGHRTRVPS